MWDAEAPWGTEGSLISFHLDHNSCPRARVHGRKGALSAAPDEAPGRSIQRQVTPRLSRRSPLFHEPDGVRDAVREGRTVTEARLVNTAARRAEAGLRGARDIRTRLRRAGTSRWRALIAMLAAGTGTILFGVLLDNRPLFLLFLVFGAFEITVGVGTVFLRPPVRAAFCRVRADPGTARSANEELARSADDS